jgi:hypothetical protein
MICSTGEGRLSALLLDERPYSDYTSILAEKKPAAIHNILASGDEHRGGR